MSASWGSDCHYITVGLAKKKIQHARYSVNMDSMKKILTRNKTREPGMCDNLLELIPWSI